MRGSIRTSSQETRRLKVRDFSKVAFVLSAALLVFVYGFAVGHYHIFPYSPIKFGLDSIALVVEEYATIVRTRPSKYLFKAREAGNGALRIHEGQMSPGPTFISGFFDRGVEMRLIQPDGSIVNRWRPRFHDVFPDPSHIKPKEEIPQTDWNYEIHGAMAFPDGSVLFNFDGKGLAKLDRCGAVQWTLPRMTHHSVEMSHDGGFWVPSLRFIDNASPYPALTPPYNEDTILKISPNGKVLMELSVLGLLFENHLEALLFANGPEGTELAKVDLTHLNDVEELSPAMAPHFRQFAAGDLLVSLRNLNLIMVVDPMTRKVKWYRAGPWLDQHDPDFLPNGKISVFSNNNDRTETGSKLGGSTIVDVDPANGETRVRYGGVPNQGMFTDKRGKHQNLDNGNTLIVESDGGRIIEINWAGDIVWKFMNRYDHDNVALVVDAIRYPPDYFKVGDWACGK